MSESTSSVPAVLAAFVAVAGLAVGAWFLWGSPGPTPTAAPTPAAGPGVETPAPAAPARAELPPPVAPGQPAKAKLRYAGGHEAPALNGVTQDIQLDWEGPWSPIVKTVVDRGWEWYVHQDGSHSTTRMIDMNGVPQAMALRAQPTQPLPVFDEAALQQAIRSGKR